MQYTAIVRTIANGRITIPDEIRQAMNLKYKELIKITIERIDENKENNRGEMRTDNR